MKNVILDLFGIFFSILIPITLPAICNGQSDAKTEITLLSLNTWEGGTNVIDGKEKILNVILKSGADIVGLSESIDSLGYIVAEKLGWHRYVTNDNDIISRFPIKKTWNSLKGAGAEIEIENGKIIAITTVHLNYTPYGPYRACLDSVSVKEIISEETSSGRMDEIKSALNSIKKYIQQGTPTFLMGDLNVPSHLDWIESAKSNHCGYIIEWPVTKAIEDFGMIDSYREIYKNPESFPGITWSPIYKNVVYSNGKSEPLDRIDYIYYLGSDVNILNSEIFLFGILGQIQNHEQNEWPSDHSAVVSAFSIDTGNKVSALPVAKFYPSSPLIEQGQNIRFTDISTNKPLSWSWNFKGGTPGTSTEQNPVITYKVAGKFSVMLISANAQGCDTAAVDDLITVR